MKVTARAALVVVALALAACDSGPTEAERLHDERSTRCTAAVNAGRQLTRDEAQRVYNECMTRAEAEAER